MVEKRKDHGVKRFSRLSELIASFVRRKFLVRTADVVSFAGPVVDIRGPVLWCRSQSVWKEIQV